MKTLPAHLFNSSQDGALYDTRIVDWHKKPALRPLYDRTCSKIRNAAELKATLRAGGFVWPGGYPLFFVMADGESMSFESVRKEFRRVLEGMRDNDRDWTPVGVEVNYEDPDLRCIHSGARIEAAHG